MTPQELRETYLSFFESKGHKRIPSASVVPENDPSVLFTTAGMHPLVPYLLGEPHPSGVRLTDVQKCVRTGDIDEVGDATHLTFFEMLGNWSLGDYFKDEAITWSFEFLTEVLKIDLSRLAVTVFEGDADAPFDEEAYTKWRSLGIPEARIARLGKEDNWWPAGGKMPGPQGPDTEMFYWTGELPAPEGFDTEDKRWVEIWNDVFMQYNKRDDGAFEPLSQKNVDTGMGLERLLTVLSGKASVYDTELFAPILKAIEVVSGQAYTASKDTERSMRIVADHVRASVVMVADGVEPSNKDQGYILRRLIRRSVRELKKLSGSLALESIARAVVETLGEAYPELVSDADRICTVLETERGKFEKTLEKGEKEVEKLFEKKGALSGEDAFVLYSTYGFPLELTEEIVAEHGQQVDLEVFGAEFKKHQDLSRAGAEQKFAGGLADHSEESKRLHTATHLLHQALRTVLGDHVEQKGSNITAERLRFDFSHGEKMTDEQKDQVEKLVNDVIEADVPVHFELLSLEEAKARGAIGLFEDKYAQLGGKVKVYFMGEPGQEFSKEVCGGPHVERTGELGGFRIVKEEASSSGVRRIKAVLGIK